mmetsp:Transcript_131673/g.421416  ORF Transcript_131673/g.421416 Transcript_131673/m.421416 type:complete len:221 (-) Transcript_131673:109-771(-)
MRQTTAGVVREAAVLDIQLRALRCECRERSLCCAGAYCDGCFLCSFRCCICCTDGAGRQGWKISSTLGSFAGDGAVAVSAPQWRVVGRNVASEWQVSYLGFFEDISCRTSIPAVPRRSDDRGKRLFNGHALSGPMRRDQAGYFALNAFEADAAEWRSTAPCGAWSDECYIGFYWLSHQVSGHFAHTIAVQFKASAGAWQTILTRSGIEGGQVQLHLPAVV